MFDYDSLFTIHYSLFRRRSGHLACLFDFGPRVTFEGTGRSKLTKLVTDHILGHIDRKVSLSIVDTKRETNHVGCNRRTSCPRLDNWWTLPPGTRALHRLHD